VGSPEGLDLCRKPTSLGESGVKKAVHIKERRVAEDDYRNREGGPMRGCANVFVVRETEYKGPGLSGVEEVKRVVIGLIV